MLMRRHKEYVDTAIQPKYVEDGVVENHLNPEQKTARELLNLGRPEVKENGLNPEQEPAKEMLGLDDAPNAVEENVLNPEQETAKEILDLDHDHDHDKRKKRK